MKASSQSSAQQNHENKPHFTVSAGVIWRNEKLLIAQRQAGDVFGGLWEFPGGKCAPGESPEAGLIREIKEEMDFEIQVGKLMTCLEHNTERVALTFYVFECQYLDGTPKTIECDDFKWITPSQLLEYQFTLLDQQVIQEFF
jgi:mutator protein MutT